MLEPSPPRLSPARIVEVAHGDPRARRLRDELDADLNTRYGGGEPEPAHVASARADALRVHPEQLVATLLAVTDADDAVGHVMLRRLGDEWELKRLVVSPAARGAGVGRLLTRAVVDRARVGGALRVILQTGEAQPEAVALYRALGFTLIPVYEPYVATMPNSLCFELALGGA